MAIRMTHIRLSGGSGHEHITRLWWTNPDTSNTGNNTRAEIVAWTEDDGGKAHVGEGSSRAEVGVVTPASGAKYLRTHADGEWNNNLLALPQK